MLWERCPACDDEPGLQARALRRKTHVEGGGTRKETDLLPSCPSAHNNPIFPDGHTGTTRFPSQRVYHMKGNFLLKRTCVAPMPPKCHHVWARPTIKSRKKRRRNDKCEKLTKPMTDFHEHRRTTLDGGGDRDGRTALTMAWNGFARRAQITSTGGARILFRMQQCICLRRCRSDVAIVIEAVAGAEAPSVDVPLRRGRLRRS